MIYHHGMSDAQRKAMFARMNDNQFSWLTPAVLTKRVSPLVKIMTPLMPKGIATHLMPGKVAAGTLLKLKKATGLGTSGLAASAVGGTALGLGAMKAIHPEDYAIAVDPETWKTFGSYISEKLGIGGAGTGSFWPTTGEYVTGGLPYVARRAFAPHEPGKTSIEKTLQQGLIAAVTRPLMAPSVTYDEQGIPRLPSGEDYYQKYGESGPGFLQYVTYNITGDGKTPPEVPKDFWDQFEKWVTEHPYAALGGGALGGLILSKAFD